MNDSESGGSEQGKKLNATDSHFSAAEDGSHADVLPKSADLSEVTIKLKVLMSEAEMSAEFVNFAVSSGDSSSAEVEIADLNRLETEYFKIFQKTVLLCDQYKVPSNDFFRQRKEFATVMKKAKSSATKILLKNVSASQSLSNSGEPSIKRLKFGKIDFEALTDKKKIGIHLKSSSLPTFMTIMSYLIWKSINFYDLS